MNSQNIDPNQKDDIKDASEVSNLKKPEHSGLDDWKLMIMHVIFPMKMEAAINLTKGKYYN
jgi:hypothetical protein